MRARCAPGRQAFVSTGETMRCGAHPEVGPPGGSRNGNERADFFPDLDRRCHIGTQDASFMRLDSHHSFG